MSDFTLHELQCFAAVVSTGGFQSAATALHRSHPAVFAAVAKLERQLNLNLLDRSGYRVQATAAGQSFLQRAQSLLREMESLQAHAAQLAMGEESVLRVVIGDVCPRPSMLALLSRFFATCPVTRLDLHFEAIDGPQERLLDDDADLILHHVDKSDPRLEWLALGEIAFVPVVASGFLPFPPSRDITPDQMRSFTQCVIRNTATHSARRSYFLIEGAHQCTVADLLMKKEIILHGMGWGHLPQFLIDAELGDGRLHAITGDYLPGSVVELVAARRRDRPHGPVANRLWAFIQHHAQQWQQNPVA
ncbi:DNA-binding transcriptional regulator, LysR family [Andreprevotia lacus DSM 23236]|jgi:DNA-binding transcriptional LysR family regulator|uniref:DNA-binding transcriptional regulator, LysR family n=1 Tax=Andreprevotia lacus DSM 23236 TaxID=1121001 RepID=A0A1W1XN26_9NEIS|nr:LysR family transcriptional regulator [Andreprevotia lacus]SMC25363.1 DNA-binding transcriptional regulator, LysR family [Andreprevotia lacus DSM 23236]